MTYPDPAAIASIRHLTPMDREATEQALLDEYDGMQARFTALVKAVEAIRDQARGEQERAWAEHSCYAAEVQEWAEAALQAAQAP